jgi:plastocyanin/mono/diheme cytochrome c family protein
MRNFVLGVFTAFVAGVVAAAVVAWSGAVDVSAAHTTGVLDRVLNAAAVRSIRRHAQEQPRSLVADPAALKKGAEHYRAMCADCHGGPGTPPEEFAAGLHPPAPDLSSPEVQAFTDGMLYWTIAQGIHSTGMPSFGRTHQPSDVWSIVTFLRALPDIGSKLPSGSPSIERAGPIHHVNISGLRFQPPELEVRVGDDIEWTNSDFVPHTATADDGKAFDTGRIDAGQSRRVTVSEGGRFSYSCRYHSSMKAILIVR